MHPVEVLFKSIEKDSHQFDRDLSLFSNVAFNHLINFDWRYDPTEFRQLLFKIGNLPPQSFPHREFGELPYTLFVSEKFFIDVYIWNSFETSIHDHHFCGAFKVLEGRSHHQVYHYEVKERIDPLIESGNLIKIKTENLNIGSTQKIDLGDKYIHQVCHLGSPTVTLCVRTRNLYDNLFVYHTSGLRFKYNVNIDRVCKILDYLDCLNESGVKTEEEIKTESQEIFDSFSLIEIMACINGHRLVLSSNNYNLLINYMRERDRLPLLESHLLALENERKFQKKLFFLKNFNP